MDLASFLAGMLTSVVLLLYLLFRFKSPNKGQVRSKLFLRDRFQAHRRLKATAETLHPIHTHFEPYLSEQIAPRSEVVDPEAVKRVVELHPSLQNPQTRHLDDIFESFTADLIECSNKDGETLIWWNILIRRLIRYIQDAAYVMELTTPHDSTIPTAGEPSELEVSHHSTESAAVSSASPIQASSPVALGQENGDSTTAESRDRLQTVRSNSSALILDWLNRAIKTIREISPAKDVIDETTVTTFSLGTVAPTIHRVQLISWRREEPLELEVDFTFVSDTRIELETAFQVSLPVVGDIISLPVRLAVGEFTFAGRARIALDLAVSEPHFSFCFTSPPHIDFEIASVIGDSLQLVNIDIHATLKRLIDEAVAQTCVYPYSVQKNLLPMPYSDLKMKLIALAEAGLASLTSIGEEIRTKEATDFGVSQRLFPRAARTQTLNEVPTESSNILEKSSEVTSEDASHGDGAHPQPFPSPRSQGSATPATPTPKSVQKLKSN